MYKHHFQPIVNMSNNQISGFEGLLRVKELPTPDLLFQKAINSNRLLELDIMSIESVLKAFSKKHSDKLNDIHLFINVFPSTVQSPLFHEQFNKMLVAYEVKPKNIVLELNELEAITQYGPLRESIDRLRSLHVGFALDDFGEGMASLKKAIELEPDYIKLDKYFAHNLSTSEKKQQLLRVILQFFWDNGIVTIIEGIENKADLNAAQSLGIQFGQGYLFGRPQELEHFM